MISKNSLFKLVGSLLLVLFFFFVFYHIAFQCESDLPGHAKMAIWGLRDGLLYFLMNLCSGFSHNENKALIACCFLLALSKVLQFWIVFYYMKKQFGSTLSFVVSFSLLFVSVVSFNLFLGHFHFYFGYFVPNVWHNSTIIFSMPFCVLIYIYTLQVFEKIQWDKIILLGLFVIISVLIKPSFFFVYSLSYSLVIIYRFWSDIGKMIKMSIPILIGLCGVIYQYLTIYDGSDGTSVIIDFTQLYSYEYWSIYGVYAFFSLLLPFSFVLLNHRRIRLNSEFCLVWFMLFFSIIIKLVFKETGYRAGHGNFSWQVIPAMWIMYLYIIKTELIFITSDKTIINSKCHLTLLGLYALSFAFGLLYLSYYLYSGIFD